MTGDVTTYSIVIPVYDEEDNIAPLYASLKPVLDDLGDRYEIMFVDDGSKDKTFKKLSEIASKDAHVKAIKFRRNFGQSAALAAGFQHATGDIVVSMDGDLQNDPQDIPKLVEELSKSYDVVCGYRKKRKDPFFSKRLPSYIFNWLASKMSGVRLHDFGCTLRAYRREVLRNMSLYGEMHRYIPALASWNGYRVGEVEVSHHPRLHGKTKYGFGRLFAGTLDLFSAYFLARYMTKPMHLFGMLGFFSAAIGVIIGVYLVVLRLAYQVPLSDRPLLLLAVLLTILGVQFIALGLISEMLTRYRHENVYSNTDRTIQTNEERHINLTKKSQT